MSLSPEPEPLSSRYGAGPSASAASRRMVAGANKVRSRYRACLVCSFVQSAQDWINNGCPNCEEIIEVTGSMERVRACTSLQFDGVIALIQPPKSWVARWQRISPFRPGLYAARVIGRPPINIIKRLNARGVPYVPRDDPSGDYKVEEEDQYEDEDEEDEDEDDEGIVPDDEDEEEEAPLRSTNGERHRVGAREEALGDDDEPAGAAVTGKRVLPDEMDEEME